MTPAERSAATAAKLATLNRVAYTPEQLAAAKEVRTAYGWLDVIRVDGQTVTVSGDFGDSRIPTITILETRP